MSGESLRSAAIIGDLNQLKKLIIGGANPCSVDDDGMTPLHYAAWNGHVQCVEFLVVNNMGTFAGVKCSCVDIRTKSCGYTALHICVQGGIETEKCCRALILAGANPTITDDLGDLPFDLAKNLGMDEEVDRIIQNSLSKGINESENLLQNMISKHKVQRNHQYISIDEDEILPFALKLTNLEQDRSN